MEKGKIYVLSSPSDGMIKGQIARFPIGLPVKLLEQKDDRFVVEDPKGQIVEFPLRAVQNQAVNIFMMGKGKPNLLVESEKAEKKWDRLTCPEKHRWYVEKINNEFGYAMCDFEGLWCIPARTIVHILKAGRNIFRADDPDELKQATADITILIAAGDGEAECSDEEFHENIVNIMDTVYTMLSSKYFVKAGGKWKFAQCDEKGKVVIIQHDDFTIDENFDWKAYYKREVEKLGV